MTENEIEQLSKRMEERIAEVYWGGVAAVTAAVASELRSALTEAPTCPMHDSERLAEFVKDMRSVYHELCGDCGGWGKKTYPSTATWRGGMGGQMLTADVCDKCWGSGDSARPWRSWEPEAPAPDLDAGKEKS